MQTSRKISSFAVDAREDLIFAGNMGGEVVAIDIDDFTIIDSLQAHTGAIEAVAAHPSLPYFAAMSMDHSVSVIHRTNGSSLELVDRFVFRDIQCDNDAVPVPYNYSLSQALTFHPTTKRLAVRSGNAGVLELDFSNDRLDVLHCTRFHREIDLVTLRYVGEDGTLLSAAGGHAVMSKDGKELCSWNLGNFNLHWFEPLGDGEYLIACDELYVIRLDIKNRYSPQRGFRLTRDDLEHVTYNSTSKRAFAAGFDGTVYEIDPQSCDYKRVAWIAPYKMRWIKTLEREPDTLIAHCFNGGLYKVGLAAQRVNAQVKETPNAIWTCVRVGKSLYFAGEGGVVRPVDLNGTERMTAGPVFDVRPPISKGNTNSITYTKRMVKGVSGLLLAEKDGRILELGQNGSRQVADLDEELRDLAAAPDQPVAFVCTERGKVLKIDTTNGDIIGAYQGQLKEPIWSLALHPQRNLLAFAERRGNLVVIDGETMRVVYSNSATSRPKRMKWCDDTLIYVQTCELRKFDLATQEIVDYVDDCGNTIEDFIWDEARQYLVLIDYRTELVLCDFNTGAKLSIVPDQADFSKGLAWVNQPGSAGAYPLDFVTFGRTGTAHLYRIHNERCMALGPIATNLI